MSGAFGKKPKEPFPPSKPAQANRRLSVAGASHQSPGGDPSQVGMPDPRTARFWLPGCRGSPRAMNWGRPLRFLWPRTDSGPHKAVGFPQDGHEKRVRAHPHHSSHTRSLQVGTVTDQAQTDWLRYFSLSNAGYEPDGNKKTNQDAFISFGDFGLHLAPPPPPYRGCTPSKKSCAVLLCDSSPLEAR